MVEKPWHDEGAERQMDEVRQKRTDAMWYLVVGVAMLFASGFHWGLAAGGVLMVGYGATRYAWYNRKLHALYDPWDDPEIDAWEEEQLRE